jgi:hypothetical protein
MFDAVIGVVAIHSPWAKIKNFNSIFLKTLNSLRGGSSGPTVGQFLVLDRDSFHLVFDFGRTCEILKPQIAT